MLAMNADLLFHVFKHLTPTGTRREIFASREPLNLCHVSRTFREIARSSPTLWTAVSNRQPDGMRALCLSLSGQAGLRIFLIVQHEELDEYADFVRELVPHSDRWTEFYFRTGRCLSDHLIAIRTISGLTYRLHLPQLKYLTLRFPQDDFYDTDGECLDVFFREGDDSEQYMFIQTWVLPCLKSLRTKNIQSLRVDASKLEELEMYGDRIDSLVTCTSLRCLTIRANQVGMLEMASVYMPNLRTLDVMAGVNGVLRLVAHIRSPQLRKLRLALSKGHTITRAGGMTRLAFFTKLFDESLDLGTLSSFQFEESEIKKTDPFPFQAFAYVLSRLPRLRHFRLRAAGPEFPYSFRLQMPALETLTLLSNPFLEAEDVHQVREALLRGSETFRTLEVVDCPKVEFSGVGKAENPSWDPSLGTDRAANAPLDAMYDSDPEAVHSGYLKWWVRDFYNEGHWDFSSEEDDNDDAQVNEELGTSEVDEKNDALTTKPHVLGRTFLPLFEPPS